MNKPFFVRQITQISSTRFTIEWTDGIIQEYLLSKLQKECPCARCHDEGTGTSLIDPARLDPNVQARRIVNVGRYALKIEFTSGCSRGIYRFSFLRKQGI